jgi:hypothetical protein
MRVINHVVGGAGSRVTRWLPPGTAVPTGGWVSAGCYITFDHPGRAHPLGTVSTASGVRVGTPAVTTRGMKEPEMRQIARRIAEVLNHLEDESTIQRVRGQVEMLTDKFPLYEGRCQAVGTKS